MERSWHLHSICPTLAAGRYLQQFWHLSEMTMFIENRISRHGGSKHNLGGPINYRTLNSSSKIAELKHSLMHLCTFFLASRLFHRFSMSARSCYHNALAFKISSDRTSHYLDGLKHSVFDESLNFSQFKDAGTQIQTIHYYIAEIYLVLVHSWGVYAILFCWRGTRCLNILMSYTQH